ncbi:MAG: 4Fe-4S binding protein, partial [Puniceicoccales bacterium]|nr:4Fe-4S binding protein [Puniceicoccales bacterium]
MLACICFPCKFRVAEAKMDGKILETVVRDSRRDVLVRVARAFDSKNFPEAIEAAAKQMEAEWRARPCHGRVRDRDGVAVCREKVLAALGFAVEEDDGTATLASFAKRALERKSPEAYPLTVFGHSCDRCPDGEMTVTAVCRNCLAKPCKQACHFGAIAPGDDKMEIDREKCKRCNLCAKACPYGAIARACVPCESACPTGAIAKDSAGRTCIDFDRCISCGKCIGACPFGAIYVKSQLIDVLRKMKEGRDVIAMPAPAFAGQFSESQGKVQAALRNVGFRQICEVAIGAEKTARVEASDFHEHLGSGQTFMTTSCCAAYNEFVAKHLPEIQPYVSQAKTPLYYTAEMLRSEQPNAVLVFFSPCFAKFREVHQNPHVDYVLSFEDVMALLEARNVDVSTCAEDEAGRRAAREAREFSLSGGVSRCVQAVLGEDSANLHPVIVDGLNEENIKMLRECAKTG